MPSVSDAIDGSWITFACPICKLENQCQMRPVALGERVHCRGCHETIQLVDKDASTVTAKRAVSGAVDDLKKALRKLR